MRSTALLLALATLFATACGTSSKGADPHFNLTTTFTPPSITQLSPDSVPVNSVPFALTVDGTNFGSDSIVFWNGVPHNAVVVTSKQLLVTLFQSDLTNFGLIPVYVRTAGLNSNTVDFNLTPQ